MPTLRYTVEEVPDVHRDEHNTAEVIEAPRVVFEDKPVDITADQAIAAQTEKRKDKRNKAKEFLEKRLADGEVAVATLRKEAEQQGISYDQLKRAKGEMPITGYKGQELGAPWYWRLDPEMEF